MNSRYEPYSVREISMKIPAWVITGLLDSGKTTLINQLIERELDKLDILVLQFEEGEAQLVERKQVKKLVFSKKNLEDAPFHIADTIMQYLDRHSPDLILIEWNGMEHFHKLEEMLLQFTMKPFLSIEKVVFAADEAGLKTRVADAGMAAFSQIAGSDCAFVRTKGHRRVTNESEILYDCNPGIRVYTKRTWDRFTGRMFHFNLQPNHWFLLVSAAAMVYLVFFSLLNDSGFPISRYISIFLGVFLQAAPFLAIGVLLSSLIQVYLPPDWIQRRFPKNVLAGQLFAVAAGFCLPVCDCASIPVFKSLVKKGVPMPAAVTFMLISPVINPVVILSTWYAFNGNYRMIAARCGLGMLCAVCSGLTYLFYPPKAYLLEDALPAQITCVDYSLSAVSDTRLSRFALTLRHAQNEFFAVGKFLLTGIFVSTLYQDMIPHAVSAGGGAQWKGLLMMMGLAFVLSLCSSSDAVVARSMAGSLQAGPILGFLVFGPMMDIKNAAMLLSGFKSSFVARLFVTVFTVCFIIMLLFIVCGSGGIRI